MSELKCKNCGGTMQIDETKSYAVCEYCGEKQKIEKSGKEIVEDSFNTLLAKSDERQKARAKKRADNREKIKPKLKKVKRIILICVVLIVALYAVLMIIFSLTDDDSETDSTSSTITSSNLETTIESTSENISKEPIEILDLFDSLETAKQILGEETEEVKDIAEYQKHTFNDISLLCEYGTSNVYSVSVKYASENAKNNYTVLGINGYSTEADWDSSFGNLYYQGSDADGNSVSNYDTEYNGKCFDIEVTYSSNNPDMIRVWIVPEDY